MISQSKNRVQAIKSKFENLGTDDSFRERASVQQRHSINSRCDKENYINNQNEYKEKGSESDTSNEWSVEPNLSYLYGHSDVKRTASDAKKSLVRQTSDPGKKLHRSHAFRCDRSKIVSPKRHGSCNGRSETSDFGLKMGEKKLSKDRLKRLGNLLEDQMRKENFVPEDKSIVGHVLEVNEAQSLSIPDAQVPQHILDQYAKVIKQKKNDNDKQDCMTDSGVSSETENPEEDKTNRVKKLLNQFEKADSVVETPGNLDSMNDLCASSETMKLERKNPHLVLTDTLKKALKQPLPAGPPPKKPPRVFAPSIPESPEKERKDAKKMLEKLEQVLQKRESRKSESEIVDTRSTKPKEIHYLCTEILDIAHKTLLPNSTANCFKSLNCAITNNSTLSLPYTRLSSHRESLCSCSNENLNKDQVLTTFFSQKCSKCQANELKHGEFKCHLKCKCKEKNSQFFVDEHIYDEPFNGEDVATIGRQRGRSAYGSLNLSKSLEDLRTSKVAEDNKIYDIPCDISRPATPDYSEVTELGIEPAPKTEAPKTDFERLRRNFEMGFQNNDKSNLKENVNAKVSKINIIDESLSKIKDKLATLDNNAKTDEAIAKKVAKNDENTSKIKEKIANLDANAKIDTTAAKIVDSNVKVNNDKPPMKPKPVFVKNKTRSNENLLEDSQKERRFLSEGRRYKKDKDGASLRVSLPKKDTTQLDVDRENLNRLMNEIYETVAAASMAYNKPGSFPTEGSDCSTSEDSVKLTRSLTEKRKNYVRRVSSRVAYLDPKNVKNIRFRHQTSICSYKSEIIDNPYNTFRSWKSFRTSQNNLTSKMDRRPSTDSKFNLTDSKGNVLSMSNDFDSTDTIDTESIDEKTGCVDIELPFEPREKGLFNVCLLVGLNYMTGQAYVKSVFPSQIQVPPHIENLVFPETLSSGSGEAMDASSSQCYSLVLTDERGERSYGYCRRVLPEGATTCLPLCYCLIGKYRAPGFYYKVLQEIESHHGSSEVEINSILQQLFETDFPNPGEEITIKYSKSTNFDISNRSSMNSKRSSSNFNDKCKTMPDLRRSLSKPDSSSDNFDTETNDSDKLPEFYDLENNNGPKRVFLSVDGPRLKTLKRPIEPRIDEDNLSILLDSLGAGLTIKVFGTLLLERKVLIMGDELSQISSCLEALQSLLYPFVWQQPLISMVPAEIRREVVDAPLPLLAGVLAKAQDIGGFQEGMLLDLTHPSKVLVYQGDESTILPTTSYKTLKTALQLETKKDREDTKMRNVMISEGFLRFFVDILGDFWVYFSVGELKEGGLGKGDVVFDKDAFIKNAPSKQNQYFLEWFTESAMFNHFIQNMSILYRQSSHDIFKRSDVTESINSNSTSNSSITSKLNLVDAPLPSFYELFIDRIQCTKTETQKYDKSNYKNAVNKRMKLLKTKLRELVT